MVSVKMAASADHRRPPARLRRHAARLGSGARAAGSRTLYAAGARPARPRRRARRAAGHLRGLRGGRPRRGARALRPLRVLDGRPRRAARGAGRARARRAPRPRRHDRRDRRRGASARRAAPTTSAWPPSPTRRPSSEFADRWTAQPLFAGTPPDAARSGARTCCATTRAALAAVLRGIGTGAMEPLWDRLRTLTMPATVLAGERRPEVRRARRAARRGAAGRRARDRPRRRPRPPARGAGGDRGRDRGAG